jgi:hypothetical protein
MLRLEGTVNGRRIVRDCDSPDEATTETALVLDGCAIHELRLMQILTSIYTAARDGRTWGWSGTEFALTLHKDNGGLTSDGQ